MVVRLKTESLAIGTVRTKAMCIHWTFGKTDHSWHIKETFILAEHISSLIASDSIASNNAHCIGSLSSAVQSSLRNLGLHFDQHITSSTRTCSFHVRNIAKLGVYCFVCGPSENGPQRCCQAVDEVQQIPSSLHWLPVKLRIDYKVLVLAYRAPHSQVHRVYIWLIKKYFGSSKCLLSNSVNSITFLTNMTKHEKNVSRWATWRESVEQPDINRAQM